MEGRLRVLPAGRPLPADAVAFIRDMPICAVGTCVVQWVDANQLAVIFGEEGGTRYQRVAYIRRTDGGEWTYKFDGGDDDGGASTSGGPADLATARIEMREVRRRQLFVDGRPVGGAIE